jgi:hypothetical protein
MSNELALDTPTALYYAHQWAAITPASTKIADDLDAAYYGLGPFTGTDDRGKQFDEAITPGIQGGKQVLTAVGISGAGVSAGLVGTVAEYLAANNRAADLVR